jgi:hypothetical protein
MAINTETLDVDLEQFKYKPKVISLMKEINNHKIDINALTGLDISELIKYVLISSR